MYGLRVAGRLGAVDYWLCGMLRTMSTIRTQIASDVVRDGLGIELLDGSGNPVAEIFRSDREKTLILSTFGNDISLDEITELIAMARNRLDPFEDGTPPNDAVSCNWDFSLSS